MKVKPNRGPTETHQVLVTEASELLKLLGDEKLSTSYCAADRSQHWKKKQELAENDRNKLSR